MKNNFFAKTNNIFINKLNAINLTALSIFLIYFLFITLLPIANGIISAGQDNLFINRNNNINSYAQVLKLKTKTNNSTSTIDTTTYINNGQMLARQIDNSNLQSYVNDAKGSVLKLNSADKSQNQIYSYDAYSKPIANTTKANSALNVINSFQYNGERFDTNTNLQYLRARFYNPETKRFANQDGYDFLNKFGYVNGNPVMGIDPSGHKYESISAEELSARYKDGKRDFRNVWRIDGGTFNIANLADSRFDLIVFNNVAFNGVRVDGIRANNIFLVGAPRGWSDDPGCKSTIDMLAKKNGLTVRNMKIEKSAIIAMTKITSSYNGVIIAHGSFSEENGHIRVPEGITIKIAKPNRIVFPIDFALTVTEIDSKPFEIQRFIRDLYYTKLNELRCDAEQYNASCSLDNLFTIYHSGEEIPNYKFVPLNSAGKDVAYYLYPGGFELLAGESISLNDLLGNRSMAGSNFLICACTKFV